MEIEIEIQCQFCKKSMIVMFPLPSKWVRHYETEEFEGLCPDHAKIKEFSDKQCPGCVGGWGDCSLFKSFEAPNKNITEDQFKIIRTGICPFRTNGSFGFNPKEGFIDIDMSEKAPSEAGIALEEGIRKHWELYKKHYIKGGN